MGFVTEIKKKCVCDLSASAVIVDLSLRPSLVLNECAGTASVVTEGASVDRR